MGDRRSRSRALVAPVVVVVVASVLASPAAATPARGVDLTAPTSVATGVAQTFVVTESPVAHGRVVAVWARLGGSSWVRLARATESRSGRVVLHPTFGRPGAWTVRVRLYAAGRRRRHDLPDRAVQARPPRVTAHRGGAGEAAENTMAAFRNAVADGVPTVETDVQATSDGHLVLVHDVTLARTTDVATVFPARRDEPVGSFTLDELDHLSVTVGPGPPQPIARFEDLLGLVRTSGVSLLAESKHPEGSPGVESRMLDAVHAAGLRSTRADDRIVFESFDLDSLRAFRSLDPDANVSPILETPPHDLGPLAWADSLTVHSTSLTSGVIADAHRRGLEVNAYVPNTDAEYFALAGEGVDDLITDRPAAALAAMG